MEVKIFGKKDCVKCQTTKNKFSFFLKKWNISGKVKVSFYDMDTMDGLTEAAYCGAGKIPTTVIENDGEEKIRWSGEVPKSEDFKKYLECLPR